VGLTAVDEREAWAEETTKKLKTALNGYGLQAAVLGTRMTPNGCLVRLAGSDRLRVEDIEAKRTQLLTTHAINLVTVQPKPGEIVVTIASASSASRCRCGTYGPVGNSIATWLESTPRSCWGSRRSMARCCT
jgi:Lon protease-like protein